jgi:glycosyltransferase involved in cell wall biosynthesis
MYPWSKSDDAKVPCMTHRYCFFIATSWGDNAVPRYFRELANELAELGNQVLLLVDGQRYDAEDHSGNPAVYTWPSKRPTRLKDAIFLQRLVRQYRPCCTIANFGAVNVTISVSWLMHVPVRVAWYRTLSRQLTIDSRSHILKVEFQKLRKRLVYRLATSFAANSMETRKDLIRVYRVRPERVHVIHNAVPDPLISRSLGSSYSTNKIICAGRLDFSKGQDVLIRAMRLLPPSLQEVAVEFVGDGMARDSYMKLAEELGVAGKCIFCGPVSNQEVYERMASAAVTIVPSRAEAFGLVNIESMAVGTPVIASRVGGIPEIIRDGIDGFLISPDDPPELASRLENILSNRTLRDQMGNNARQRFLEKFEISRVIGETVNWLESLFEDSC